MPIATEYKYLGCIFQSNLSWELEKKNRLTAGTKALYAGKKVLQNKLVKVSIKLNFLKAMFIPVVLYGAEIWYESQSDLKEIDKIFYTGLRCILNCKSITPKCINIIYLEAKLNK